MSRDVHSCTHWLRPRDPPPPPNPPAFGLIYEGAIGQQWQTTSPCNPMEIIFTGQLQLRIYSFSFVWLILTPLRAKNKNKKRFLFCCRWNLPHSPLPPPPFCRQRRKTKREDRGQKLSLLLLKGGWGWSQSQRQQKSEVFCTIFVQRPPPPLLPSPPSSSFCPPTFLSFHVMHFNSLHLICLTRSLAAPKHCGIPTQNPGCYSNFAMECEPQCP